MSAVAELRQNRELIESLTTSTLTHSRPRSSKAPTRAPFIPAIAFVVAFMMAAGTERSDRRYTVGRPTNQRARYGDQTDVTQSLIGALPFFHHRGTYRPDHQHDVKTTDREVAIIGPSITSDISTLCDIAAAVRPGWTSAVDYFISLGPPRLGTEGRWF
ncbi:hypothetical protein ALC53_06596 [Atta colombica]|uniref:Uncharacterized protein n=1 Tax=Atta colombica TaxID=520822 RepID=A0A195BFE0_9HYME|nr:hypothetical protein ALC53_06596 [Atta colombica]